MLEERSEMPDVSALVMGGGEYYFKRVGQRSSWKLFGWTVGAELVVLALPWLLC
jgi:hypothetical protein